MSDSRLKRILVVDDEIDLLTIANIFLTSEGFDVVQAVNGLEAKNLIEQDKLIDLVVTDIRMPEMDGIALLRYIKSTHLNLPVIVITGGNAFSDCQLKVLGADEVFPKPYDFDQLLECIQTLILKYKRNSLNSHRVKSMVYYLEDELFDQELLTKNFFSFEWSKNFELKCFSDEVSFVSALKNEAVKPELVILDVYLNGSTSFEIIDKVRRQNLLGDATKLVAITSCSHTLAQFRKSQSIIQKMYTKPVESEGWKHLVENIRNTWIESGNQISKSS